MRKISVEPVPGKPFLQNLPEHQKERRMTEEEKQRAVDLFFVQEKVRRENWKRAHGKTAGNAEQES